jgi:hypothetical protein
MRTHRAPKLLHEDGHHGQRRFVVHDPGSKSKASGLENIASAIAGRDIADTTLRRLRARGVDGGSWFQDAGGRQAPFFASGAKNAKLHGEALERARVKWC